MFACRHKRSLTGSWFPEADAIFVTGGTQKFVDFFVEVFGAGQIFNSPHLSLDQVITVDGAGHGHFFQTGRDELQHGHLGGRILHRHPIGTQSQI